jgi:predicted TIM-barrel fold metal-dependent hydrolase
MFRRENVFESYLAERGGYLGYDISAELLNLGDTRVAAMDATGIDMQVMSLTMPGCEGFETETAIAMATDANDRLAEAIHAHPSRLAGFAALPTAKPATAAKELERAVTKLGFKGAMINGHVRGEFLDNQKYWAIFECAQALNVPIYLHPTIPHPDVHGLFNRPTLNHVPSESPIDTDSKTRDAALSDQLVKRGWVNLQWFANFFHRSALHRLPYGLRGAPSL